MASRAQRPEVSAGLANQHDSLDQVVCRLGDNSCANAHAAGLSRAATCRFSLDTAAVMRLQRQYGNRYTQRVIGISQGAASQATLLPTENGTATIAPNAGYCYGERQHRYRLFGRGVRHLISFLRQYSQPGILTCKLVRQPAHGAVRHGCGVYATGPECNSPCGEYRQYVRGSFTRNGSSVAHALCSHNLDPNTFYEDCANIGGTEYKYGYHSIPFGTSRFINSDQATGIRF